MPSSGGYAVWCRIQVLAGLAPSSQTVGSLFRVIREQTKRSSCMKEANIALFTWQQSRVSKLPGEGVCYSECFHAEFYYAECCYSECRGTTGISFPRDYTKRRLVYFITNENSHFVTINLASWLFKVSWKAEHS